MANPVRFDELLDMIENTQKAISDQSFGGLTDGMGIIVCDLLQCYKDHIENLFESIEDNDG